MPVSSSVCSEAEMPPRYFHGTGKESEQGKENPQDVKCEYLEENGVYPTPL